ncbi:MAG: TIR domain-containing protein [Hyphomicrobiaceae bacterium]
MATEHGATKLKVFISYSRRNSAAADALVEALAARGFEVTIDRRDLPFGEKWQAELAEFIRLSDTVVWLISDASIQSKWVNWELDEVARRNKRLVPVMIAETPRHALPRQIGEIHILPAEGVFEPPRDLDDLLRVLETDRAWLKEASRLQDRAHEWLGKSRTSALLLSRGALTDAERWKDRRPSKAPAPAQEVMDLLLASKQAATGRQRWWIGGSLAVALGAITLAGFAFWQREVAVEQRRVTDAVRQQAQTTESGLLSNASRVTTSDVLGGDSATAMLLALEGLPDGASDDTVRRDRRHVSQAELQLDRSSRNLRERMVIAGHHKSIVFAAWSPDGTRFATASWDASARVWDSASGLEIARLVGHEDALLSLAWSPDGKRLVTTSKDRTARVWDALTGKQKSRFEGHRSEVYRAKFSPDGVQVVTTSAGRFAHVWDAETGKPVAQFEQHAGELSSGEFSPDGRLIVTASPSSRDSTARVWDAANGKEITVLLGHEYGVNRAVWAPDGARVATASNDKTARVWDLASGHGVMVLSGHTEFVWSVAWSPDGKYLATASFDTSARVWDAATAREVVRFDGHTGPVVGAEFSPNGRLVVTASTDGTARLWDVTTGKEVARLMGHCLPNVELETPGCLVHSAAFNTDGSRVLTASDDQTARVWDTAIVGKLNELRGHCPPGENYGPAGCNVSGITFSPGGSRVLTNSGDRTARIWSVESRAELVQLRGHTGRVLRAAYSKDGTRVVTTSTDDTVRVWDAASGVQIARLDGLTIRDTVSVESVEFSPDGSRLVTASYSGAARLWDSWTGKQLLTFNGHTDAIWSASFSPDGTRIVTASRDKTARVWDVTSGAEIARLVGHEGDLNSAKFRSGGTQVVTASFDQTVRVWDVANGKEIRKLGLNSVKSIDAEGFLALVLSWNKAEIWDIETGKNLMNFAGHTDTIRVADFTADGKRIVTAGDDLTVRLWDAASGKELTHLKGHTNSIRTIAFNSSGDSIAAISLDDNIRVWGVHATTDQLVQATKARAARCLTQEQRKQYYLPPAPPTWCVERRLWPYHSDVWQGWLPQQKAWLASNRRGDAPALPKSE